MYEILTPSTKTVINLAEMKAFLRVDSDDENAVIEGLIKAAIADFETKTGYIILSQVWALTLDVWPTKQGKDIWWDGVRQGAIEQLATGYVSIEMRPFNAVTKVETIVDDGSFVEMLSDDYYSMPNMTEGQLFANRVNFPSPARNQGGIKINFYVGHQTEAKVPFNIKNAVMQLVEHWYEKEPKDKPLPKAYLDCIAIYRKVRL